MGPWRSRPRRIASRKALTLSVQALAPQRDVGRERRRPARRPPRPCMQSCEARRRSGPAPKLEPLAGPQAGWPSQASAHYRAPRALGASQVVELAARWRLHRSHRPLSSLGSRGSSVRNPYRWIWSAHQPAPPVVLVQLAQPGHQIRAAQASPARPCAWPRLVDRCRPLLDVRNVPVRRCKETVQLARYESEHEEGGKAARARPRRSADGHTTS